MPKGSADPNIVGTAECGGSAGHLACSQTALDATASNGDAGSRVAWRHPVDPFPASDGHRTLTTARDPWRRDIPVTDITKGAFCFSDNTCQV